MEELYLIDSHARQSARHREEYYNIVKKVPAYAMPIQIEYP